MSTLLRHHERGRRRRGRGEIRPAGDLSRPRGFFGRIYKGDFGDRYLAEASDYAGDVIDCTRDICNYIYDTHGRFPAHCETIHVPGIWIQIHHVEEAYYDRFFNHGLTPVHRDHQRDWHA